MEAYVMDAFSERVLGGNQAGVVLPDRELDDRTMQLIAAEFKHSETAFVKLNEGEHMGRPSEIRSILTKDGDTVRVRIGGCGVMSMSCELKI